MTPLIVALPGDESLAEALVAAGGFELGGIETRKFPDGETYLRHCSDLKGRSVALVCGLHDPDPKLMALLLAAASARDLGACRVGLVAPYLGYMRQDHRFHPGEAVSAVHFAHLLSGAVDWLATVDPHLHRIHRLDEVFSIPTATLHAGQLLAAWIGREIANPVLIGPDAESEQWVAEAARIADAPFVVATKARLGDRAVKIEIPDIGPWRDRTPVLVDDVVSSGQTLLAAAEILGARGIGKPACAVVHGLFADDAYERLSAWFEPLVSANTIPHSSNRIDIAPLLAGAVARLGA